MKNYGERNFGAKLQEVKKTNMQLLMRRVFYLSVSVVFIILTVGALFILLTSGYSFFETWYIGAGGIAIVGFCLGMAFLYAYWWKEVKSSEAILYESGLIYTFGEKQSKVAFRDVAGTLFLVERVRTSSSAGVPLYTMRVEKRDGTEIDIDEEAAKFRNFREFYKLLDTTFAEYMLKKTTPENLHKQVISFGYDLVLRKGKFVYLQGSYEGATFSLYDVAIVERKGEDVRLLGYPGNNGKNKELAKMRLNRMLNIQVLYGVIEMAKKSHR